MMAHLNDPDTVSLTLRVEVFLIKSLIEHLITTSTSIQFKTQKCVCTINCGAKKALDLPKNAKNCQQIISTMFMYVVPEFLQLRTWTRDGGGRSFPSHT